MFSNKRFFLLYIKYGPSIMALTCCLKIHILSKDTTITHYSELIVHWINWIMNLLFLGLFYISGKYFHYCWKHQSLCRIALWGYMYYAFFLLFNTPHDIIHPISLWYVIFVIFITLLYKNI